MTALTILFLSVGAAVAAPNPAPVPAADPVATAAASEQPAPLNSEVYGRADELYARRDEPGAAENARRLLEQALTASPLDIGLMWRYGRARIATGERTRGWGRNEHFVAAEQSLLAAIDIDPDLVEARYWLALARLRRSRYKDALETLDRALELAPDDARLHHLAGDIRWRAPRNAGGDRDLAVKEYEKALELSGRFGENYVSLAEAYLELGRTAEAGGVLDRLEKLRDANAPRLAPDERDRLDKLRKRLSR